MPKSNFKSFDGWQVTGSKKEPVIVACFTKKNDEPVRCSPTDLLNMHEAFENTSKADQNLIMRPIKNGPSIYWRYDGWQNLGSRRAPKMFAAFTQVTGGSASHSLSALHEMAARPLPKSSTFDRLAVQIAIDQSPKHLR